VVRLKLAGLGLDLGARRLLPEWRALLQREALGADLLAGLRVAALTVPLSMAVALASRVSPAVGLVTAVVTGVVCALFGGTPLGVTAPAAAMAVLVGSIVEKSGIGGLLVVVLMCGSLQLLTGVLKLGRLVRLVPAAVVEGFTAGIGIILIIGQLPSVLGLPPPPESHVFDVITHIGSLTHEARPAAVAVSLSTLGLVLALPRIFPSLPASLIGVAIPTAIVTFLGVGLETLDERAFTFRTPALPASPADGWGALLSAGLMAFALASLQTSLSSTAVDKASPGPRHDADQELIGQGLANLASALFGGLPATGVAYLSIRNVQAGARTRRASVFQALFVLVFVLLAAPLIARVPVAALAGVLFGMAIRLIDPSRLASLWRVSRADAIVYVTTLVSIVFVDLVEGVQWGLVAAFAIAAARLRRRGEASSPGGDGGARRIKLSGPLTFLASLRMEKIGEQLAEVPPGEGVVLDMSEVPSIDASGAEQLEALVARMRARKVPVALLGVSDEIAGQLSRSETGVLLLTLIAPSWQDALKLVSDGKAVGGEQRLLGGVQAYRRNMLPRYAALYEKLSESQSPHTLFITCSDSRIQPALLTSTDPGELFLVRNVGNMVPPSRGDHAAATGAAIEYAVGVLGVSEVVVCGHSRCGAIKALRDPSHIPLELGTLRAWASTAESAAMVAALPSTLPADEIGRLNALRQLDNLHTYQFVSAAVAAGKVKLHVWFFHVGTGEIEAWNTEKSAWEPLGLEPRGGTSLGAALSRAIDDGPPSLPPHGGGGRDERDDQDEGDEGDERDAAPAPARGDAA
jgi:carbonic anhydrase